MAYSVLVIGDSCIDIFQYGKVNRICPEAPCPVFVPTYSTENEGMAGNVVANLKAFGGNINIDFITNEKKPIKKRVIEEKSNQMLIRIDEDDVIEEIIDINCVDYSKYKAVVVVDYDKGFLTDLDLVFIALNSKLTFLDTKKKIGDWGSLFSFIKINEHEYKANDDVYVGNLIITLGSKGAMYKDVLYPTKEVVLPNVSGAGDTFLAALVYKYLQTNSIEESIIFANQMAAIVVTKRGTSTI